MYVCAKENNHTKQYLCGLAICLYPRSCTNFTIFKEKYKILQYNFSSLNKTPQTPV